jgi:nickel-dependent lactate racemase
MEYATIEIPYGSGQIPVQVPQANLMEVFYPRQVGEGEGLPDEAQVVRQALAHPIGTPRLRDLAHLGDKVVIVTSDLTRPCPSDRLIPYVLEELAAAGIPEQDITIVLALGLHRPMSEVEIDQTVSPAIRRRFRVLNHDINDTVHLGQTSSGTPVEFYRPLVEADVRICLGNLEFHWFAGYSGGAKAILPGCASRAAVTANHAMLVSPEAAAGRIEDNPLRRDLEEAVAMLGVDFILNVVVDGQHRILGAVAGEVTAAHRAGCEMVAARGKVKATKADIVLASAGGFPKDINLYQAHKGLEAASCFVRDGGVLILAAECREGIGNAVFESWVLAASSPRDNLERIRNEFVFGGHKAAAIAAVEQRASIYMVSAMPDELVRRMWISPYRDPQAALEAALARLGPQSRVLVLPQAGSLVPEH